MNQSQSTKPTNPLPTWVALVLWFGTPIAIIMVLTVLFNA